MRYGGRGYRSSYSSGRYGGGTNWPLIGALIFIPAVVLGAAVLGLRSYLETERIDELTYCYERGPAQAHTAVFLDSSLTAHASDAQWRDFETVLMRAYLDSPANGRVSIFTTTRNVASSILPPVASLCRPAMNVAEAQAAGVPERTPQYLARQALEAEEQYRGLIAQVMNDARDEALAARESPILASLQAISRSPHFVGGDRVLWAITDGLENSEIARFGQRAGDAVPYEIFSAQARFEAVRPRSWAGTHVNLLLVENGPLPTAGLEHVSSEELYAWYPLYFRENGADSVEITRLRRGAE